MGAALALQAAIISHLAPIGDLTGVYHDAPARASFPYAILICGDEKDWSCKGRQGREIALQLVLWDEQPARLLEVEKQVVLDRESILIAAGWHLSSLLFTGKRRVRNPLGPWNCVFEFRVRMLSNPAGEGS